MREGLILNEDAFMNIKDKCIAFLTNYLYYNSPASHDDLDITPFDFLSCVHKSSAHAGYLPFYLV